MPVAQRWTGQVRPRVRPRSTTRPWWRFDLTGLSTPTSPPRTRPTGRARRVRRPLQPGSADALADDHFRVGTPDRARHEEGPERQPVAQARGGRHPGEDTALGCGVQQVVRPTEVTGQQDTGVAPAGRDVDLGRGITSRHDAPFRSHAARTADAVRSVRETLCGRWRRRGQDGDKAGAGTAASGSLRNDVESDAFPGDIYRHTVMEAECALES